MTARPRPWRRWWALLRPGDVLCLLVAIGATLYAGHSLWSGDRPDMAVVRAGGRVVARLPLERSARFSVQGPIGTTWIEVQPGRARVQSDPGPRQYCVKQGWLTRNGAAAICAPNHVTLQLEGRRASYDTLTY